jgi:hypothetical protein
MSEGIMPGHPRVRARASVPVGAAGPGRGRGGRPDGARRLPALLRGRRASAPRCVAAAGRRG